VTTYRITYKPPGPIGPAVTEVNADWWDLQNHHWFYFYRTIEPTDVDPEPDDLLILSVAAETVVSVQRIDD
jgi:hypothetical protein